MLNRTNDYDINIAPRPAAPEESDIRCTMTSKIWRYATAMLGLCVPLMAVANHAAGSYIVLFPLSVIAGATGTTALIWVFGSRATTAHSLPSAHEQQQLNHLKQIDERLSNLETISNYERLAFEEQMRRQSEPTRAPEYGIEPQPYSSAPLHSGVK